MMHHTFLRSESILFVSAILTFLMLPMSMAIETRADTEGGRVYFVAPEGDDTNPGTRDRPWRTPDHAGQTARAGDTVVFEVGRYPGSLAPAHSGSADAPIVFRAAAPRAAHLISVTDRPGHPSPVVLEGVSHIRIEGFRIEDVRQGGWLRIQDGSFITIADCRFEGGTRNAPFHISNSEQIKVLNNDFARRAHGGDMVHFSASRRVLFEGNSLTRALHTLAVIHVPFRESRQIVFRGNVFHSGWSRNLSNTGHDDVLVENNIFTNGYNGGRSAGSVNQFAGNRNILRFNQTFRNFGVPWILASSSGRPSEHVRMYHNVFYGNHGTGLVLTSARPHMQDVVIHNNVFFENDPYGSQTQLSISGGGPDSVRVTSNVLFADAAAQAALVLVGFDAHTLKQAQAGDHAEVFTDNREAAPAFTAPERFDFSLMSSSPLRETAAPLTRVRSAGAGRMLPVEDPFPFYDGYGIDGEVGDVIAVGAPGHRARVVRVDHKRRVLHLDRDLTWAAGDAVAFPWAGAGPDVGLYEHAEDGRPSVQVRVSNPFPQPGERVELEAIPRGIDGPIEYQWWLGDDTSAEGPIVRHTFPPGEDYGIRVRVIDRDGRTHRGVGYVNLEPAPSEDVLLHTTFDADDGDWWVHWQFYRGRRGTGYTRYAHHLDERTGEGHHHIAPLDGTGPLPAILHPRNWDIDRYPTVRIRYRIHPGTPIAIFVTPYPSAHHAARPWDFRMDSRRYHLAGTRTEPRGDQTLIDDGQWHEITLDVRGIREHWPQVQMLQALHIGDMEDLGGTPVEPDHAFWLDDIYIGK